MTLNLTELRDEPLGKHPIPAIISVGQCYVTSDVETAQDTAAPDDVRSFTFDVDGLRDEALDSSHGRPTYGNVCLAIPLPRRLCF